MVSMDSDHTQDSADRIAALTGRLGLYIAHLAGPALRRRIDPADLVQDAQLRALRSETARALEGEDLWRFLRTIARGAVVDAARQARLLPRRAASLIPPAKTSSSLGPIEGQPGKQPGPHTQATSAEEELRLQDAFEALSPEHRRVIGLRRLEGLSAAETGSRMGRSESAVHSLYRRALSAWAQVAGDKGSP